MDVKVKICGITNEIDALAAAEAGADAVGFMFYKLSPRHISINKAAEIAQNLPSSVMKVGVFVDASEDFIKRAMHDCKLDALQFHGNEEPQYCTKFDLTSIKAFRIRDARSLNLLSKYPTDAWLLDAFSPRKLGGTGEKFNWNLAIEAKELDPDDRNSGQMTQISPRFSSKPVKVRASDCINFSSQRFEKLINEVWANSSSFRSVFGSSKDYLGIRNHNKENLHKSIYDLRGNHSIEESSERDLKQFFVKWLKELPEIQSNVVSLHYGDDLQFREIGNIFGLTESYIREIHTQAVYTIRSYLRRTKHGLSRRPIFLAGGLNSENITQAVSTVHPFAVDVSSGVEASPGKKDHAKVRDFISAAKSVEMPENAF